MLHVATSTRLIAIINSGVYNEFKDQHSTPSATPRKGSKVRVLRSCHVPNCPGHDDEHEKCGDIRVGHVEPLPSKKLYQARPCPSCGLTGCMCPPRTTPGSTSHKLIAGLSNKEADIYIDLHGARTVASKNGWNDLSDRLSEALNIFAKITETEPWNPPQ